MILGPTWSDSLHVRHEIYLDYGPEEAKLYFKNAASLGEVDRLHPDVLAIVDPQAFWATVLHIKIALPTIEALGNEALLEQWQEVYRGVCQSKRAWKKVALDFGIRSPPAILTDEITPPNWSEILQSGIDHEKAASGSAHIALLMMLDIMEDSMKRSDNGVVPMPRIDMQGSHYKLEMNTLVQAISKAKCGDHLRLQSSDTSTVTAGDRALFMKNELEAAGFGGEQFAKADPLESCKGCGKVDDHLKLW